MTTRFYITTLLACWLACATLQVADAISALPAAGAVTVERQDFSKLASYDTSAVLELEARYIVRFVGRNVNFAAIAVTFTGSPSCGLTKSVTLYTDGGAAAGAVTTGNRPPGAVADLVVAPVSSSTLGVSWAAVTGAAKYLVQWDTTPDFTSSEVCLHSTTLIAHLYYCAFRTAIAACAYDCVNSII
jgi:hypothetical protein